MQGNFTTVSLLKPHNNPESIHEGYPRYHSTERQGEMMSLWDHTATRWRSRFDRHLRPPSVSIQNSGSKCSGKREIKLLGKERWLTAWTVDPRRNPSLAAEHGVGGEAGSKVCSSLQCESWAPISPEMLFNQ